LNNAKQALARHGTASRSSVLLDSNITTQVLRHFTDFAEFITWHADLVERIPAEGIRSWGFYEHDARYNWPQRRAEVKPEPTAAKREPSEKDAALGSASSRTDYLAE